MMEKIEHSIDIREMCSMPFAFSSNRVWRVYQGGKMIDALQHKPYPADSNFPEEWIASSVKACNPQRGNMTEGISNAILDGELVSFQDLINMCPEELLGRSHVSKFGKNTAFLTKLLDSAARLPIQAHPDNLSARQFYNSTFGKTEAWIILDTREIGHEKPYLMLGFNDLLDESIFKSEAISGNMPQSLQMLHKHPVASGDVLLISGGSAHAIGPGVFLLEIMEPTDLVVQPENYCGTQRLTTHDRFGTLNADDALKIFHYNICSREEAWSKAVAKPEIIENSKYAKVISLLDRRQVKFFGATRISVYKELVYDNYESSCSAGVMLAGSCILSVNNYRICLQQGDCFFIPACCRSTKISGCCSFILTHPPHVVSL